MDASAASGSAAAAVERIAREGYGKLIALLAMRSGDIAAAEDALSEALVRALEDWPRNGTPANPAAWLLAAARRLQVDRWRRSDTARRGEDHLLRLHEERAQGDEAAGGEAFPDHRLALMLACAHPSLDPAVHAPLMLQAVLGLDARRIASALLLSPAALGQRLARAKAKLKAAGARFALPDIDELPPRMDAVLNAIYVAFTAGWDGAFGDDERLARLTDEAIWLARLAAGLVPPRPEAKALASLLLFIEARRPARRSQGRFVPLADQDTAAWSEAMCREAEALLVEARPEGAPGRFGLEAAIQAVHAARRHEGRTDWDSLEHLYRGLIAVSPTIGARLGHAAALAAQAGPRAGLDIIEALPRERVAQHQPYWALHAHLSAAIGDRQEASASYLRAIGLAEDEAVRLHLMDRRNALMDG